MKYISVRAGLVTTFDTYTYKRIMTVINKLEFKTVEIAGMNTELTILTFSIVNYSIYFSMQSVAQCINEMLAKYGPEELFYDDFTVKWKQLDLKCLTEFELEILVPANLILQPSTELHNPMPFRLVGIRYLNDKYGETIRSHGDIHNIHNDPFCIAEQNDWLFDGDYHTKFMNGIGFLSLIPIIRMPHLRKMYKTFFQTDMINSNDIDYIHDTLVANRLRMEEEEVANVFQLDLENVFFEPEDVDGDVKQRYVKRFNRGCRIFKTFAFNIMDEQSLYISQHLQIVNQFGLDRATVLEDFKKIPKLPQQDMNHVQKELLCRDRTQNTFGEPELNILQSIIKIHLMIQRMTNTQIHEDDLKFYRHILATKFSTVLEELICVDDTPIANIVNRTGIIKNYTMGEIVGEFLELYDAAQRNSDTLWLCKFIKMSCHPRYSTLVSIMADFVPFFQRFFTNDFNVDSINNIIIFLQGMCSTDNQFTSLQNFNSLKHLDVEKFKTFTITKYEGYNANPLVTFVDLMLTSRLAQQHNFMVNLNTLNETERHNLISLIDPNEQQFIDYIYQLMSTAAAEARQTAYGDALNMTHDLSGDERFNLQDIDYEKIVPIVSTNTFNENNVTCASMQLFKGILNQTTFFHELTNRIVYKVPGIVSNIVVK